MDERFTAVPSAGHMAFDEAVVETPPDPLPWSADTNILYLKLTEQAWRDLSRGGQLGRDALEWFEGGCNIIIEHPRTRRFTPLSLVEVWGWNPRETINRARARYAEPVRLNKARRRKGTP